MKLDIIVPHYHEPWEVGKYLFDSIALQRMVDFQNIRVILVNDGREVALNARNFGQYPFDVDYYFKDHEGVSAARNYGLDHSDADYVMFCDFDDGFLLTLALYMIKLEAEKGYNIINPMFMEECMNYRDNKMFLQTHESDATFLHGKAYNRKFLMEHDIRFPEGLNLHEDGYFNSLAICIGQDNIVEINTPLYLWRWNDNSVVRSDYDFTLRTYDKLCECWRRTLKWLKDNGYDKEYRYVVAKTVISTYYSFMTPPYLSPRNSKYVRAAEKAFKELYLTIENDFLSCGDAMVGKFCEIIREDARKSGFEYELTDLRSWLKHIKYQK